MGKYKEKIKNKKKVTCQDCTVCVQYIYKIKCKVLFVLFYHKNANMEIKYLKVGPLSPDTTVRVSYTKKNQNEKKNMSHKMTTAYYSFIEVNKNVYV